MIDYDDVSYDKPTQEKLEDYKKQVALLSNLNLVEGILNIAGGDDYDGCFTAHGNAVYNLLREELDLRLKTIGFLE